MVNISIILRGKKKKSRGAPCHMPPPCHTPSTMSYSPPCRFERSEKSPSCGRERIKGRPLTSFGETEKGVRVTFLPCPAEQYRGTPRLSARGDKKRKVRDGVPQGDPSPDASGQHPLPCRPEARKCRGTPRLRSG
jgi:hypothetical protein